MANTPPRQVLVRAPSHALRPRLSTVRLGCYKNVGFLVGLGRRWAERNLLPPVLRAIYPVSPDNRPRLHGDQGEVDHREVRQCQSQAGRRSY